MNKISVSTLVRYLKNSLETDTNLKNVQVNGELSNFHHHSSGHLYFTLKDDKAALSCVMFASRANTINFPPKNGDKVLVTGNISIFENSGQLQLYVNSMKLDGIGDLFQQYEELKNKLYKEGYFEEEHKKSIETFYPSNIAVIVGDKSAAMSDIKKQFSRRWPLCNVDYYPCLVQGDGAAKGIINNLLSVDEKGYEGIILARGGGSFEDLFCFNDENLVKTIYNLKTFIITGIGHEQDFTLADFVADLRAPTPTACVELITPNIEDVIDEIDSYKDLLHSRINNKFNSIFKDTKNLINNRYLLNPMLLIDKRKLTFDYYYSRLNNYGNKVSNISLIINNNVERLREKTHLKLSHNKDQLNNMNSLLNAYSLNKTLNKGFSIVLKDKKIVKDINDIKSNDEIEIMMHNGQNKYKVIGEK